ncbi:MAG: DNA cytosine methyltransferase [Sulfobacillus sp.]
MDKICVVDLFCGMGGFSFGASLAGAKVVLAIDSWGQALEVHALNHPDAQHLQMELGGDIAAMVRLIHKYLPPGASWHLHGSPPCQLLSNANRHNHSESGGMRLVNWYLNLVRACRPDSWSMEQVPAAFKHLGSRLRGFDNALLVNAADYGVPQTRRRLFIGNGWRLPPPCGEQSLAACLPHLQREGTHIKGYSNTRSVRDFQGRHLGNRQLIGLEGLKSLDVPTFTLCASGPLQLYRVSNNTAQKIRNLTVDECLTIQGFPSGFRFPGGVPDGTRYKLIGNSVCPLLSYLLIRSLS